MTVLIDSDVLIEVARGRDDSIVSKWLALIKPDTLVVCSTVTVAELWAGARASEHKSLEALFESLVCIPADSAIGRQAGVYLREFQKSHGLELGDALIAATAHAVGARLWTRNRKHYPMRQLAFFA